MGWRERIVYTRDFAYTARRLRMANGNISDVPAATYAELLSGSMLDIYVGPSRRRWALHRNLLFHHSEALESELYGDDGKPLDSLELPDHDPEGFELLVKWLYQGKLDDVSDMADASQKYDYAVSCYKLYMLCDRFDMPQLKNVAMDQYRKGLNEAELVPDAGEIDEIYRKSPEGSPFRRLMTQIAARQIMDPGSDRNIETYRQCFTDNPDFAVDLVNAIKQGTGGMLFDDPTDPGNECAYHDHETSPSCHIKGKGKPKIALKASALRPAPRPALKSANSAPPAPSAPPPRPLHLPHHSPSPPPAAHPRQARRQDGIGAGPLRRRLTSPASSTVETTTENATASTPSPKEQKEKARKVMPPEKRPPSPTEQLSGESRPAPAPVEHHPSSDEESRPLQDSTTAEDDEKKNEADQTSPRQASRIWEWAKAGTGRLNIMGRIPHPEWKGPGIKTSKAATSAVNGALEGARPQPQESHDDFSIPSSTSTAPTDSERPTVAAVVAKIEGLGFSSGGATPPTADLSLFSQTKRSSDDLVAAASTQGTPSPQAVKSEQWVNGEDSIISTASITPLDKQQQQQNGTSNPGPTSAPQPPPQTEEDQPSRPRSPPATPSPAPRKRRIASSSNVATPSALDSGIGSSSGETPSPHRIPKYKIALAANILSPARAASASS